VRRANSFSVKEGHFGMRRIAIFKRSDGWKLCALLPKDQKPQYEVDVQPHTAKVLLLLPQHCYRYAWLDPKSGQTASEGFCAPVGETQELQSPEYREDIALRILEGRR